MRETISIQYLRAIAAGMVVVYHALTRTLPTATHATFDVGAWAAGVDVFFVISGWIMWTTTAGRSIGPVAFWRARLLRIVPMWWLALATFWLVLAVESSFLALPPAGETVKALLFVPYRDSLTGLIAPFLVPGWSLSYEMVFYFVFGVGLFLPTTNARFGFTAMVFAAMVMVRGHIGDADPVAFRLTSPLFFEFLAGMMLAAGWARWREAAWLPWAGAAALVVAAMFIVGASRPHYGGWPRIVDFGLPAVLMVFGATAFERFCDGRPIGLLKRLGDGSYSLYLAHEIVQHVLGGFGVASDLPAAAAIGVLVVASLVAGLVVHEAIEKPLGAALKRRFGRRERAAASPAPSGGREQPITGP